MAGVPLSPRFCHNPCEIFNASTKRFFTRRRYQTQQLLQKVIDLVELAEPRHPVSRPFVSVPSPDVVRAAVLFRKAASPWVVAISDQGRDRALQVVATRSRDRSTESEHDEDDGTGFSEAFDDSARDEQGSAVDEPDESVSPSSWAGVIELATEQRAAQRIYIGAIMWSLRAAHQWGIPVDGWTVGFIWRACQYKYFLKFSTCAHIIVARFVFKFAPLERWTTRS
ncbi:hypothetical protein PybrP1_003076 [[Pythium] brassicae (nom. inval.)]|nr:hypothetical protein PybrP1_003076 [[Pythium] brassicae (nom. inval.)]